MFNIKFQRQVNNEWETVKSITMTEFSESVANKAIAKAESLGIKANLYIAHTDKVPNGYCHKILEYTTSIWKGITEDIAIGAIDSLDLDL